MSIASSRSNSLHDVAYGARYLTFVSRVGLLTSCSDADPLGHRRPREIGLSGSPSIWITRSSRTNTFWPQPTAQYGQTDRTTRSAVFVRASSDCERPDCAAFPRPSRSPLVSCLRRGGCRPLFATRRLATPNRSSETQQCRDRAERLEAVVVADTHDLRRLPDRLTHHEIGDVAPADGVGAVRGALRGAARPEPA